MERNENSSLSPFLIWKRKWIIFQQLSIIITKPDFVKSMKLGKKKWFLMFDNIDHFKLLCMSRPICSASATEPDGHGTGDISENRALVNCAVSAESSMKSTCTLFSKIWTAVTWHSLNVGALPPNQITSPLLPSHLFHSLRHECSYWNQNLFGSRNVCIFCKYFSLTIWGKVSLLFTRYVRTVFLVHVQ